MDLKTETEKCLKNAEEGKAPEAATEIAASLFDLTYNPNSKSSKHSEKIYPQQWPRILAALAGLSIHILVGIVVGYSAILIPQLEAPDSEIPVTKEETSWIASLAVLAVPVVSLLTGYLVDTIGRQNTLKAACIPYILGWVLIATATNLPMIYAGRLLTGFTLAMGPSSSIVYSTEVSRPDLRGSLICLGPALTSVGMLIVYIKGSLIHWRIIAWSAIAYSFIPLLCMYLWAPESPVWLHSKGKTDKALKSLRFLARAETKEGLAERQLAAMDKDNSAKNQTMSEDSIFMRFFKGFSKPTGYKPALILLMLFTFQQFSGIYITIFYAVTFFQEVGSGMNAYVSAVLIGVIRMLVGLLTSILLKRFGRRPLCMISGLGITLVLFISGYYTRMIQTGEISDSVIPVICILIYISLGVTGLMTIPWTMTAELFPLEIRGLAQGLIVSLAHVVMFAALQMYRRLGDVIGGSYGVQWFFAATSFLSVVFVFIFVPETHKKMLSEIQDYFQHNSIYLLSLKPKSPVPTTTTNNNQNNVI